MQELHGSSAYVEALRNEEDGCWADAAYVDEAKGQAKPAGQPRVPGRNIEHSLQVR